MKQEITFSGNTIVDTITIHNLQKTKSITINAHDFFEGDESDDNHNKKFPLSSIPEFATDEWVDACEQLFSGMRKK